MTAPAPDISLVVCAFDMARELPRTIETLSPAYQRGIDGLGCEVIVLDNGSTPPVDATALRRVLPGLRVFRPANISRSPVAAINRAVAMTKAPLVGLFIDGARMASPGLLALAHAAWRRDPARAIGTPGFHLGPAVQMQSVAQGYDAATEDALLASVPWQRDGYRLFDIAVLAGSSRGGWEGCIAESNALFMDRALWDAIGGLDERFASAGGGFCNLDLWDRAVAASDGAPWIILGEATFHQVHGGAATSGTPETRREMAAEYARLRGHAFATPAYTARRIGSLDHVPPRHRPA
jgi:glycosyltransferase involved in cell wall biosynthesis